MEPGTLRDLYIHQLKELLSCSRQLILALPKMAKAAWLGILKESFKRQQEEIVEQANRLETILLNQRQSTRGPKCQGMIQILAEAAEIIEEDTDPEIRDAKVMFAVLRAIAYETASYGTAKTYAELLGDKDGVQLLQKSIREKVATKEKLEALRLNLLSENLVTSRQPEESNLSLRAVIDPGSATQDQIDELFNAISELNRAFGGEGIVFLEATHQRQAEAEQIR